MAATTSMASLRAAIADLTTAVQLLRQELAVHSVAQQQFEDMVHVHEIALYGDKKGGAPGIVSDVARIERTLANLDRVIWIVVTPLLIGVGGGIVYLIQHSGR